MPRKERKEGERERDTEQGGLRGQRLLHPSPKPRLAHRCSEPWHSPTLCLACCSPPGHQQKENNLFLLLPGLLLSCFKPLCFVQDAGSAQVWEHLASLSTNHRSGAQMDTTKSYNNPCSPFLHLSHNSECFLPLSPGP